MTSSERCLKPEKREISCWHPRRRTHPNQNFTFALKLLPDGSFVTYSFLKDFCILDHFGIKFWLYLTLLIPNFPVVCTSRRLLLSPFPLLLVPEGTARRIGGERGLDADAMPFVFFFHLKQISFFIFVVF